MASVYDKMTALADVIRGKSGATGKLSLDGMTSAVESIVAGGGGALTSVVDNSVTSLSASDLDGIEEIRSYAFYGCSNLTSVGLPDTLESIGTYAFYNCSKLKDIVLPSGLTSLGARSFYGCKALEKMVIPEGVTSIPIYCFYGCSNLKTLILVGDTLKPLANVNALNGTVFLDQSGDHPIYIATINADVDELVAAYREATNWADYETPFAPISEYEGEW